MFYYAMIITPNGTVERNVTPFEFESSAKDYFCDEIADGWAKGGWIENNEGTRVIEFEAIKEYCSSRFA